MCDSWKDSYSKELTCEGMVFDSGNGEYIVKGKIESIGGVK